jgi:FKBP-type peptidyl-prolyl cis-trans isomerase FkpA
VHYYIDIKDSVKMKQFFILLTVMLFVGACGDKELTNQEQYDKDIADIETYIKAKGWTAQKTVEGIYYVIDEAGSAQKPTITSTVKVDYVGKFIDESIFDSGTNLQFGLSSVIQGWQIGIPKFGRGGKGKLLIPSEYAYSDGKVRIFDVTLHDF